MHPRNVEKWVFRYINSERRKHKLRPLEPHPALIRAARRHSRNMMEDGTLTHHLGGFPYQRAKKAGYPDISVGENCAMVYCSKRDPSKKVARQIVNLWMSSPGHRKNILLAKYRDVGIGIATTWNPYYRRLEVWATAMFGWRTIEGKVLEKIKEVVKL